MLYLFLLLFSFSLPFQTIPESNSIDFLILDEETGEPMAGATAFIQELNRGVSTNSEGHARFENLPDGTYTIEFRFVGYESEIIEFDIPFSGEQPVRISMEHEDEHLDEITISTTRTTRSIENIPTRIEAITTEEIAEKGNMRPGDIRMLLAESTGIQVQQTSAISGNANFRIQGLGGRYTQLLKDGFPLFSGFSGGLSIMQIPPLDLHQVEIVKGANSTLYGGGAIAGLVNLITKEPQAEREISLLANLSTSKSRDLSGFYSEQIGNIGITLFTAYNQNSGYDPSDQGFSAIPNYERFTLNPRLIFDVSDDTRIMAGAQLSLEDRLGGDMLYISGEEQSNRYFEQHDTRRISTQFELEHQFSESTFLSAKNSFTFFERSIEIPDYIFEGNQVASFNEIAVNHEANTGSWVGGLNLRTDHFEEQNVNSSEARNTGTTVFGMFLQNTTGITEQFSLESGLRTDYVDPQVSNTTNGWFLLPRVSALYRFNNKWSMRLGGGLGYILPDMFTADAENRAFQNVLPPDMDEIKAEQSYGANYDINFNTVLADKFVFRFNQLFYFTALEHPLVLEPANNNMFAFDNLEGNIRSMGTETNVAFIYNPLKLFLGYTYVDAVQKEGDSEIQVPLNSPHQINAILMLEEHDNYRLGFEAYYYSPQKLNDSSTGRGYTIFGIMGEKSWGNFTLFANLENIFDTRQTRFGRIYTGSREQPEFKDIFAPLEGRYVNVGIKIRL